MAEAGVLTNMFHVENFICFFKLRGGTLFSLYLIFILSLFGILCSVSGAAEPFYTILILLVSIANLLVSGFALIYFPGMNKKYDKNSVNTKCIKYFSIFNGVMLVLGYFPIVAIVLNKRITFDTFMAFASLTFLWTVVFAHFAAVSYSFYLSILQPENEHQSDLVTNNVVNKASEKNINFNVSSGRKNDTKIDIPLQPIDPSANGSGNLYVELR